MSLEELFASKADVWIPLGEVPLRLRSKCVIKGEYCTLPSYDKEESYIAKRLVEQVLMPKPDTVDIDNLISSTVEEIGISLAVGQKNAVKVALSNNVSIITGGPGTGKTTVLNVVITCLEKMGCSVINTAPTGKAAIRMTESTGRKVNTLHKEFLDNRLYSNVLVIDEGSMMDMNLMYRVLYKTPETAKIILVGDPEQLLSVGCGEILNDLLKSGIIPTGKLTETFRQKAGSTLLDNIKAISKGDSTVHNADDYKFVELPKGISGNDTYKLMLNSFLEERKEFGSKPEDVCILLPTRRKGFCTQRISRCIQSTINPNGKRYDGTAGRFVVGDYVVQLVNRNADGIVNGSIGQVTEASTGGVTVRYDNTAIHYSPSEMEQLELSYAMTIHKSQGSEYKSVIIVLLDEHSIMLNRNLIYTAVTRAKQKCTVIANKAVYEKAVKIVPHRKTMLVEKLHQMRNYQAMVNLI